MFVSRGVVRGCDPGSVLRAFTEAANHAGLLRNARAEMAAFFVRAISGEVFAFQASPYFFEVPVSHPFFKYVEKSGTQHHERLRRNTILPGSRGVSRRGARAADAGRSRTHDVPACYIQKAAASGITQGCGNGMFRADAPTLREQVAVLLMRALFGEKLP
jgi:hypothetical protein